jgi:hypothetical protein
MDRTKEGPMTEQEHELIRIYRSLSPLRKDEAQHLVEDASRKAEDKPDPDGMERLK